MRRCKSQQAGQLLQEHLSFLKDVMDFIITKYLKQEGDDNLSVCVDEHSPCGLSITGDIKIYHCHAVLKITGAQWSFTIVTGLVTVEKLR